ncbi:hypothetical protein ONZ51_g623 [Trametes cubensis]|uniref:F-box domain-containing protein n=1 Tax=Trametes cubensis TaxID=1111947 RepID=A0AAD7U326_9APHY|nr:hypothetical protein ONZ51_g623 [Trametes cubensis]
MSADPSDALRADTMRAPYYGLPPPEGMSMIRLPLDAEQRSYLTERSRSSDSDSIYSINTLLNTSAPINRLPVELLVMIMKWVQVVVGCRDKAAVEWLSMLLVCRHWFVVASTGPRLWYALWAGSSLNLLRTGLARSKETEILIVLKRPSALGGALECITPHAHRIRHLFLSNVPQVDAPLLSQFMRISMPALATFHALVSKTVADLSDVLIDLTPEAHPSLIDLHVGGVHLSPSPVFRQLRSFRFSGCFGLAPHLRVNKFLDILRNCINAVVLDISDVFCRGSRQPPPALRRSAQVVLSKLAMGYIKVQAGTIRHILSAFVLPASAHALMMWATDEVSTEDELGSGFCAVMPNDRSGLPILRVATHLEVKACRYHRRLIATAPTLSSENALRLLPGIILAINASKAPLRVAGLEDVLDICRTMPLETASLKLTPFLTEELNWDTFLFPFRGLRVLTLINRARSGEAGGVRRLLRALEPDHVPNGTPAEDGVLCPRLRIVRIEGFDACLADIPAAVLECVQKRKDALGQGDGLEKLELHFRGFKSKEGFERQKQLFMSKVLELVRQASFECDLEEFSE